jgi:hypothetical protein
VFGTRPRGGLGCFFTCGREREGVGGGGIIIGSEGGPLLSARDHLAFGIFPEYMCMYVCVLDLYMRMTSGVIFRPLCFGWLLSIGVDVFHSRGYDRGVCAHTRLGV